MLWLLVGVVDVIHYKNNILSRRKLVLVGVLRLSGFFLQFASSVKNIDSDRL